MSISIFFSSYDLVCHNFIILSQKFDIFKKISFLNFEIIQINDYLNYYEKIRL